MKKLCAVLFIVGLPALVLGQAKAPPPVEDEAPSLDQLYEAGKSLFDQLATPEMKEQYEFPSKEQWDAFAARLQTALEGEDLAALAAHEEEARTALTALRLFPEYAEYADWLQERIDYIEAARDTQSAPPPKILPKPPEPNVGELAVRAAAPSMPHYDLWLGRMRARPVPASAGKLMPVLQKAFVAEGIPAEIAWLAEVESTLNPSARSPVGAKGLFQFMPETAKSMGLSTFLPDERTHPEKSAQAAAKYLKMLHGHFGDWPLAFAAYNAGEGRVRRLLKAKDADSFSEIASSLPSETRMYVPKVCATIEVRAGVPPEKLAPPSAG